MLQAPIGQSVLLNSNPEAIDLIRFAEINTPSINAENTPRLIQRVQHCLTEGVFSKEPSQLKLSSDIFSEVFSCPSVNRLNWASDRLVSATSECIASLRNQARTLMIADTGLTEKILPATFYEEVNYLFKEPLLGAVRQIHQIIQKQILPKNNRFSFEYRFLCMNLVHYLHHEQNPAKTLQHLHNWCEAWSTQQAQMNAQASNASGRLEWLKALSAQLHSPLSRALVRLAAIQDWTAQLSEQALKNNLNPGASFWFEMNEVFQIRVYPPVAIFKRELFSPQVLPTGQTADAAKELRLRSNSLKRKHEELNYGLDSPLSLEEISQRMNAPQVTNQSMIDWATCSLPPTLKPAEVESYRKSWTDLNGVMHFRDWLATLDKEQLLQEQIRKCLSEHAKRASPADQFLLENPYNESALQHLAEIFLLHTPSLEVLPAPTSLAKSSVSSGLESGFDEDKASSAQGANQQLKAEQNSSEPSASEYSDFESVFTREDLDWQLPLRNDTPALKRELRELVTAHQINNSAFLSSSHSQQALDNPTLEEFLPFRPDSRSLTESPWASLIEKNSSP